jgi:hypothetical protein
MSERARPATLEDLKRVLAALHAERADYLLIGGYALIAHGLARATVDIDLLVPARREAAAPIQRALLVLPDKAAAAIAPEWFEEGEGIRVGDDIVVDLVFRTCGETYDSLRPFEEVFEIDGVQVRTINLEGLLRTKQSARGQDVTDRMAIERALAAAKGGKDRK